MHHANTHAHPESLLSLMMYRSGDTYTSCVGLLTGMARLAWLAACWDRDGRVLLVVHGCVDYMGPPCLHPPSRAGTMLVQDM
jgi:hypothetical protein